jgi:DNA replication protein DnaC
LAAAHRRRSAQRRDCREAGALDQVPTDPCQAAAGQEPAPAKAGDIEDFDFTGTPVNEVLIRDLASGAFLAEQRNAVLIGGTGTGKSHLAIAIAPACIRGGGTTR